MFKLLFIGGLIYLLYRISIPSSLQGPKDMKDSIVTPKKSKEKKVDEDDYIDYEEVD